jgi:hypothetical protein
MIPDAVIIASELVTNAIRHARLAGAGPCGGPAAGCVGLAWQFEAGQLVCVVTDHSDRPPVLVLPGPDAESGHGLQIVQALSAAWGWTMLSPAQKAVWAALPAEALFQQAGAAGELEREPLVGVLEVDVQQVGDAAQAVCDRVAV